MAIDRLIGILSVLLREEQTTAGRLAERFEVSVRTIQRDIDRLCRAGIPLRTARGAGGGISIMEGYGLDRTVLTDEDRGAILAGLRSLDSVSGTGYYRQLMERLPQTEALAGDDCVVIDLASWYGPAIAPRLALLKDACARRRLVSFTYCAPGGESRREVEPYQLVFRWSSWYLYGWCRDEGFPPRPAPSPITPVERVYPGCLQAAVRFAPSVRWRLVDEYGAGSFTQSPDGSLLFRRGFPGREELLRWVLTFGDAAEILEPVELRGELKELAKKIWEKYDS